MWLPVSLVPVVSLDPYGATVAILRPRGTALRFDDEDIVRMSTADMLIDLSCEVVKTASAKGALQLLAAGETPDVVVTDHLMPGMSGAALAERAP